MIRTQAFACSLPKAEADALNRESGRIYTRALVEHYRVFRQTGHWLSASGLEKLVDAYDTRDGRARLLHAHSVDAAQQGFPKACQTAKACKALGLKNAHHPHKRKFWRTTLWKATGLRPDKKQAGVLLLARASGLEPIRVTLPSHLAGLPVRQFVEMRLVWDKAARRYHWHSVIEDGQPKADPPGPQVGAGDLGEIHPIALSDGAETRVVSARALRAVRQRTNKRLAALQWLQSAKVRHSRQWQRLQRRKNRFLAQQKRRARDTLAPALARSASAGVEHKVSRAVVAWAVERQVGTLALGDVRAVADGKRLNRKAQQKVSNWSHGQLRQFISYKAEAAGIRLVLVNEAYSSQTCPQCGERHKPRGRLYRCPACGFVSHRDGLGAVNILSRHKYGEVGKIMPPEETKYRHPFDHRRGKRSRLDTAELAWAAPPGRSPKRLPGF